MRWTLLLPLLLAGSALGADLHWDTETQSFETKPGDHELVAHYRFTNTGSTPVTIDQVKTSCGCTTAELTKKTYEPGESGEIVVRFNLEGRSGATEKSIVVTTGDPQKSNTYLHLKVNIPEAVHLEPTILLWRVGDQPETKDLHITVDPRFPTKVTDVESDSSDIKVEIQTVKPGQDLNVKVTPKNLSQPEGATLVIRTDYPTENPQSFYAYIRIK
jgi:Protein of unknown function (DUF1573)